MQPRSKRLISFAAVVCASAAFACTAATGDPSKESGKDAKKTTATAASLSPTTPVAVVGDKTITLQELDVQAASALTRVRQEEYDARRQALDAMVNNEVLMKEAAAKKVGKDDLLKTDVSDKVTDPPQAEIDSFYEQHKPQFGTQTKEQLAPQIAAMLKNQKLADAQRDYMKGLRKKYGVKTLLEPPRIEIAVDNDAAKGPAKAPVTIVEFSDYQCPYCSRAEMTVQEVLKKYGDKVRLVYRDYPLQFHPNANIAAQASECAKDQVQKDFDDGQKYGVTGTPTFFINGIPMVGARDVNSFAEIIDSELERNQ